MSDSGADYELKQCARCAAWIPRVATMCAYCGTSKPDERPAPAPARALSLRHGFRVTDFLVAANVVYLLFSLYVQHTFTPRENLLQTLLTAKGFGAGLYCAGDYHHPSVFDDGQWWRVLTATFLHAGVIHIAFNMMALRQLGHFAEELFGPAKFLTVYVVSAVCSTLAGSFWYVVVEGAQGTEVPQMVGASGAVFGVAGLLTVFLMRAGTVRSRTMGMAIGKNLLFMLVLGFLLPFISQTGHVGGLLPGMAFGWLLKDEFSERARPASRAAWARVATLCVAATLVALGAGVWWALRNLGGR